MNVLVVNKEYPRVENLVIKFHQGSLKVVEFIMELHHESPKDGEASIEALPHRFQIFI